MRILEKTKFISVLLLIIAIQFIFIPVPKTYAATNPDLGTAANFSILAGSAVTNTGSTTISKNVGIYPGTTPPNYTGFGTVTFSGGGSVHDADGVAQTAQADNLIAYDALASQGCNTDYGGGREDLAGKTLVPGVYCAGAFDLTGTLTLNGDADDVWIFKSASDLVMTGGTAVKVLFTGGGNPCNVWWRVVSSATFDANSSLVGNILALTSVTFAAGASLDGRALAQNAEVTLSSNSITGPTCVAAASSSSSSSSGGSSGVFFPVCPPLASTIVAPFVIESRRVSPTSIFFSWGPSSGTNIFNIQYGFEHGKWLYNTDVTGFSTTINDLPPNQPIWVQIAGRSDCRVGSYGVSKLIGGTGGTGSPGSPNTGSPLLPNAGIGPDENNIPWYIPAGIFVGILALLTLLGFPFLIQRKYRFSSKS